MLKIYAIPISLYCAKLRILLRHKNLQWQEILPPGGYGSDEYKQIVASGNLPALVDGELLLADSEAIAEYLNEKFPELKMLPTEIFSRAKIRELSRFHDTRLEPEIRQLFAQIRSTNRDRAFIENQSEIISQRLHQLAQLLPSSDVDKNHHQQLTLADCGYPISFEWLDQLTPVLGLQIDWPDAVIIWRQNLLRHKAIATELADYQPKLTNYFKTNAPS